MAEISTWFNSMPTITKYWFGASVLVPVMCRFGVVSPYKLILTTDFLTQLQLWRPFTAFLYYPLGNSGFRYLMNLYFLYNYSKRLEEGFFSGRTADYCFMMIFNWLSLLAIGCLLSMPILMDPLILSILYVWCMVNRDQIVTFWFGTRFTARYLPWVLFGMNFLLGGGGGADIIGIFVGHLYYFVTIQYPTDQQITLIHTPRFLYDYFPNDSRNVPNAARAASGTTSTNPSNPPNPATRPPTGYSWGRGRRLED